MDSPSGDQGPTQRERRPRGTLTIVILLGLAVILLFTFSVPPGSESMNWPEFKDLLATGPGKIERLELIVGESVFVGTYAEAARAENGTGFKVLIPNPESYLTEELEEEIRNNVGEYEVTVPSRMLDYVFTLVPWIILIALFYFLFFRQGRAQGGPPGVMSFGKSRAKMATKEHVNVTFDDVAGVEEAKAEVAEIVAFLKDPMRFQRLGGRVPKGVLLIGSPGTGKTLLAKAIAGEADVPFFSISGSDFVEMFVGVGASRVRDLFKQARESSPCIIFLDEIDAVGRRRGAGLGGGHDEREQTLNAILVEMDGFDSDAGIIMIAATNRHDILDPALLRPGRFDRQIVVDLPDLKGREGILEVHARGVTLGPDVDLKVLARSTPGYSGADLEALINEAALTATMKDKEHVEMDDMEEARDKIKWGRQNKSRVVALEDRRITAFHEAGHALVAHYNENAEPLHKVTIIPRGMALGATMQLPDRERYHMSRRRLLAMIEVLLAGRIAEEIFCNDITSGAQNDIERATEIARRMVTEWGMSDLIGPVSYREGEEHLFLGHEVTRNRNHSEELAVQIDNEVKRILTDCYETARKVVEDHSSEAEALTENLLTHEVLNGPEVAAVLAGDSVEGVRAEAAELKAGKLEAADREAAKEPPAVDEGKDEDEDAGAPEAEGGFAY